MTTEELVMAQFKRLVAEATEAAIILVREGVLTKDQVLAEYDKLLAKVKA